MLIEAMNFSFTIMLIMIRFLDNLQSRTNNCM